MPKDASKNVDRYKVRGGHLNEYDFEKEKAADKTRIFADKKTPAQKASGREAKRSQGAAKNKKAKK